MTSLVWWLWYCHHLIFLPTLSSSRSHLPSQAHRKELVNSSFVNIWISTLTHPLFNHVVCTFNAPAYLGTVSHLTFSSKNFQVQPLDEIHIFHCMGKMFCVEFQKAPLKFHTIRISYPCFERADCHVLKFNKLLDVRTHVFWMFSWFVQMLWMQGVILGLPPANEKWRSFATMCLAQA